MKLEIAFLFWIRVFDNPPPEDNNEAEQHAYSGVNVIHKMKARNTQEMRYKNDKRDLIIKII